MYREVRLQMKRKILLIFTILGMVLIAGCDKSNMVDDNTNSVDNFNSVEEVGEIVEEVTDISNDDEIEAHEHSYTYEGKDNNTHIVTCSQEDCDFIKYENCKYEENDKCICGNEKPVNPIEDFQSKVKGVWGYCEDGYESSCCVEFDGEGNMQWRYFYSMNAPIQHITKVKLISENIYEVTSESEPEMDFDEYIEGGIYKNIVDGTIDGFEELLAFNQEKPVYFMRLASTVDEALQRYDEGFAVDYYNLLEEKAGTENEMQFDFVGNWCNQEYIEDVWSSGYVITLNEDMSAMCDGWRNEDYGTYEYLSDQAVLITFDKCKIDFVGEGWYEVPDFYYSVEMKMVGNNKASIKFVVPNEDSNLGEGAFYKMSQ